MSKIGFCFSGEGARGAIQAGIALDLFHKGIKPDFVCGVSSGSVCAASYAYLGAEGLAQMWRNVRWLGSVFGINWDFLWNTGFLNQKPGRKIVENAIKNEPVCEAMVARLNIETGEMQYVSNKEVTPEEFAQATMDAFCITAMCSTDNGWVDAGSRQMAPLKQCIDAGCDEIYVILGRPFHIEDWGWKRTKGLFSIVKMAFRALDVSLQELLERDLIKCVSRNIQIEDAVGPYSGDEHRKEIKIHLLETNEFYYSAVEFRKCRDGVDYGQFGYNQVEGRNLCQRLGIN